MNNKKFLCVWNEGSDDEIFQVHDHTSLYDEYKRTNLFEDEFGHMFGDSIYILLEDLEINQKITFDNMDVTRIR